MSASEPTDLSDWRATNWLTDLSVRYLHAESISSVPIAPMQPKLHLRKENGLWQKVL